MFRLYSNENFPLPVVEELRRLGCDVTTVLETGRIHAALVAAGELRGQLLRVNRPSA